MKFQKLLANEKITTSCQPNTSSEPYIERYKKTVRP